MDEIKYCNFLGIRSIYQMQDFTKNMLTKEVNKWDLKIWRQEMEEKSTLNYYRQWKKEPIEENIYDNTYNSVLLYQCRSNTNKLNWRKRFEGGETRCELCGEEEETVEHILIKCNSYHNIRVKYNKINHTIKDVLFFNTKNGENANNMRKYIGEFFIYRKKKLLELR